MDDFSLIGYVVTLISIVAAVIAIVEFVKKHFFKSRHDADASVSSIIRGERVVLEFNNENIAKTGTFENKINSFEARLPHQFKGYNPHSFYNSATIQHNACEIYAVAFFIVALAVLPFNIAVGVTPAFIVFGGFMLWNAVRLQKALHILRQYIEYLDSNKIRIGFEFTQAREVYERNQT